MIKLQSDLHSRTTPNLAYGRAMGWLSRVIQKKNDRDISRAHCIHIHKHAYVRHVYLVIPLCWNFKDKMFILTYLICFPQNNAYNNMLFAVCLPYICMLLPNAATKMPTSVNEHLARRINLRANAFVRFDRQHNLKVLLSEGVIICTFMTSDNRTSFSTHFGQRAIIGACSIRYWDL